MTVISDDKKYLCDIINHYLTLIFIYFFLFNEKGVSYIGAVEVVPMATAGKGSAPPTWALNDCVLIM